MSIKSRILHSGSRLTTRFSSERKHSAERLNNIMDGRRRSAALPLVCTILLATLLSGMIVSCRPGKPAEEPVPTESTLPVTEPIETDPAETDPAETDPVESPLTERDVMDLYEEASPLWMLFHGSSEGEGLETIRKNYLIYNNDTKFGTMAALRTALTGVFSDALTETLLARENYCEHDGRLWVLMCSRGSDIRCGETVRYEITAFSADRVEANRIVDVVDLFSEDEETFERAKIGEAVQKLVLIRQNGAWVFDAFADFDDLSEYDSRYPIETDHPDLHTIFASLPAEVTDALVYTEEDYAAVADALLHPDAHRDTLDAAQYALYSSLNITDHYFQYDDLGMEYDLPLYLYVNLTGKVPLGMNEGWNCLPFVSGIDSLYLRFLPVYSDAFEAETALRCFIGTTAFLFLPETADDLRDFDLVLFTEYLIGCLNTQGNEEVTRADLTAYAEKCFGIRDFEPAIDCDIAENGTYYITGHGGILISYRILDCSIDDDRVYTINVQYYADPGCQIPSHLISYRIRSDYADWIFLGSESLVSAEIEPWQYCV